MSKSKEFHAVITNIFLLDNRLREIANQITAPAGQTGARWQVFNALESEPLTVAEIARRKNVTRQSIQRLADELAAEGQLRFEPNPFDNRAQKARLTPKGQKTLKALQKARVDWLEEAAAPFSLHEIIELKQHLVRLSRQLSHRDEGKQA